MIQSLLVTTAETADNTIFGLGFTASAIVMLLISCACGIALGAERSMREKEAGIRTHVILILGSTLFTIISCSFTTDAARIMAQIVPGVGFLGAGIIMFRGEVLHGLTTAAGIWTTAGIGMAIGNGLILIGFVATALVLICQIVFHSHVTKYRKAYRYVRVAFICNTETIDFLKDRFQIKKFGRLKIRNDKGTVTADAIMRTSASCAIEELTSLVIQHNNILSLERLDINKF